CGERARPGTACTAASPSSSPGSRSTWTRPRACSPSDRARRCRIRPTASSKAVRCTSGADGPGSTEGGATLMNHTAVIGAGTMGVQIALLLALHEHDVTLIERDESTRRSALERADAGLARHASRGRISHDAAEAARARIEVHADLDAVAGAGLVIEAITEVRDLKRDLLAGLDRLLEPDALLASNSSSFVPSSLATGI